jgi:transcriptional regulator with XRE-family HTH domain
MNAWAKRIKDLQEAGMTQAEIATKIGMSASGVGDIAQSRTKAPTGDAALALDRLHRETCPEEAA